MCTLDGLGGVMMSPRFRTTLSSRSRMTFLTGRPMASVISESRLLVLLLVDALPRSGVGSFSDLGRELVPQAGG